MDAAYVDEWAAANTAEVDYDAEREATHAKVLGSTYIDQWVDWGGVTVQVDPMGTKQWVHDTHDGHERSAIRGRAYDLQRVKDLLSWEATHTPEPRTRYTPTTEEIDRIEGMPTPLGTMGRFAHGFNGNRRDYSRVGQRPAISSLLYGGKLINKDRAVIDAEILAERRRLGGAVYDRSDWSDLSWGVGAHRAAADSYFN